MSDVPHGLRVLSLSYWFIIFLCSWQLWRSPSSSLSVPTNVSLIWPCEKTSRERWLEPLADQTTHVIHRKETTGGKREKFHWGVARRGFVFIKVNSYLGALLFTQVAKWFFRREGERKAEKSPCLNAS
jgi:hypothetical protein